MQIIAGAQQQKWRRLRCSAIKSRAFGAAS
jgi:hypothetical protein